MRRSSLFLLLAMVLAGYVIGHVRLIYSGTGAKLFWINEDNISIVINKDGSDDISDQSHFTALRNAINAWNRVDDTVARLVEDKSASEQASTNWQSNGRHLMLFDESNTSGYFPGASGIVAITPLTFYTNGQIIDADVLFNGKSFLFTTEGTPGRFDVQDVATHELGHLLGLDHSGSAGATMYPYVDATVILHRSLSLDDIHGLQDIYPDGTFSRITGKLTRASDGSVVKGAWIGARDAGGRLVGAALSGTDGNFYMMTLSPGTYTVYATPLDQPVTVANLSSGYVVQTDFEAKVLGSASPGTGATVNMGTLTVNADVAVELGRVADDYPLRTIAGQANALTVRGANLAAGSTLTASDSTVALSGISWNGSYVTFTATPTAGAAPGHVDLTVTTSGGDTHILCGALEITPPDPAVTNVSPALGDPDGGVAVTLTGTNFNPDARVVIGDRMYRDGIPNGCVVVNSTTITLTTKKTLPGVHDVVVIDDTGVEGRRVNGFDMQAIPVIDVVFPAAGAAAGGTTLTINGDDFVAGTFVTIDGTLQSNVTINSLNKMTVVTEPGVAGGPYVLQVETPSGQQASAAFVYTTKTDPVLAGVNPGSGNNQGGETIQLTGTNFTANSVVFFGPNSLTGNGGVAATSVTLIDSTTLEVVTPASSSTRRTVMVLEDDTGQASMLTAAFTFEGNESSGGGGGGCASIRPTGPPSWGAALSGAGWVLLLAVCLALRAWRAARAAALVGYAPCPARND
jgi:Matrixin/IPT/TIG domain